MKFVVHGGRKLEGVIRLAGAKNAATKMMVASLLTPEPCIFENFPIIDDTAITRELCRSVGSEERVTGSVCEIRTPHIVNHRVPALTRRNRIPILMLGPLLARCGEAEVPFLGGDRIGPRPVDIHLTALSEMGASIETRSDRYIASARGGLRGAAVTLRYPSVGATENTILAAVLAKGRTVLKNAAVEPEIIDLVKMLQKMGAIIELGTNRTIYIDGVSALHGARHRILPDRNEAVSFACLAVAGGGNVLIEGAEQEHLITFLNALRKVGGEYAVEPKGIRFWRTNGLRSIELETDTHPGFMTDWQQPFTALLTQAHGTSVIHETVYEDRFAYTADLNLMGADITVFTKCLGELPCRFNGGNHLHSALIRGGTELTGKQLTVRDLRSGIVHIIAALVARGASTIEGAEEIDRGYERIDERLRSLGADMTRVA